MPCEDSNKNFDHHLTCNNSYCTQRKGRSSSLVLQSTLTIEERHRFGILIVTDCILFGKWKEKPMALTKPSVIFDDRRAPSMYIYI